MARSNKRKASYFGHYSLGFFLYLFQTIHNLMKKALYLALLFVVFTACKNENESIDQNDTASSKVDFDGVTESIKPGDNFFEHVNKTWLDSAVIADDEAGVGSYSFLNIPQKKLLENILTEVSEQEYEQGSIEQMVGDFYASGMDTLSINKRGLDPLRPTLDKIDAIANVSDVLEFVTS